MIRRIHGFTLLETLVAMSILAISLGVIYQIFGTSLRNIQYTNDYSHAQMLAASKLSEIGKGIPVKVGVFEGNFDKKYSWIMDVSKFSSDSGLSQELIQTYKVNFKIFWGTSRGEQSIQLHTYRLSSDSL